jgi:hypothetical protein
MTRHNLLEPILDDGVRDVNYFNGRLLTAEDMRADQIAGRRRDQRRGRAVGEGIINGLEVRDLKAGSDTPAVRIEAGLAVNGRGDVLDVPHAIEIDLVVEPPGLVPAGSGLFEACKPPEPPPVFSGDGFYVLLLSPASELKERAPRSGLGLDGRAIGCDSRYAVEGVQVRLERVLLSALDGLANGTAAALNALLRDDSVAARHKVRNWFAHLCFGSETLADFGTNPFEQRMDASRYERYGALDTLRVLERVTECDVPLAALRWNDEGIQFLDPWAARRRSNVRSLSSTWPATISDRRVAEAHASFLQFQNHANDIVVTAASAVEVATIQANNYFRYLPPAGIIRVAGGAGRGFQPATFFGDRPLRPPTYIEGARVEHIIGESFRYPPIDVQSNERVWVYLTRESSQALQEDSESVPAWMIFTSGHMPFFGAARYDVHRWDFSNYL